METEIGAAPIVNGTATLDTGGDLCRHLQRRRRLHRRLDYVGSRLVDQTVNVTIGKTSTSTPLHLLAPNGGDRSERHLDRDDHRAPAGVAPTGTVTFTNTTSSTTLGTAAVSQVIVNQNGSPAIEFEATLTVASGTFSSGTCTTFPPAYSGTGLRQQHWNRLAQCRQLHHHHRYLEPCRADSQHRPGTHAHCDCHEQPAAGTPSGTLEFYDETLPLGAGTASVQNPNVFTLTVNTSLVQSVTVTNAAESTNSNITTVTLTTDASKPMTIGESVTVEGITTGNYNGTFTVTAVSGNTFSYLDSGAQGAVNGPASGLAIGLYVLTPGLHSISAVYTPPAGSTSFATSTGVLEQSVQGTTMGTAMSSRNEPGMELPRWKPHCHRRSLVRSARRSTLTS